MRRKNWLSARGGAVWPALPPCTLPQTDTFRPQACLLIDLKSTRRRQSPCVRQAKRRVIPQGPPRVAVPCFCCARRRGLAKSRPLPPLRLGCFVRRTRLGCAATAVFNAILDANPIILVISLIGMLASALYGFAQTNTKVGETIRNIWDGSRAERVQWTKQRRRGWRSAPIFASGFHPAPRKSAKRKRHERRPLPVAETGSREWLSRPNFQAGSVPRRKFGQRQEGARYGLHCLPELCRKRTLSGYKRPFWLMQNHLHTLNARASGRQKGALSRKAPPRVAVPCFCCARRRGLAKSRPLPLLRLACFVRRTRLGCAAVLNLDGREVARAVTPYVDEDMAF